MWLSVALLLSGFSALIHVSVQGPHQRTLLKNLLKDYNRMERPVGNDSHSLTVYFSLSLIQIMDVDEKNQVLTTNIWLQMNWFDHYLQWNESEHPGVKNLRFTTDQVWTPDILLYNSADDDFDSTFKTNVLVNSSGYAKYLPPGEFPLIILIHAVISFHHIVCLWLRISSISLSASPVYALINILLV
ncbi:neuronal acetylcholine receptor subunit alpha-7-like [Solea senegalensis]|uniref:Neuronal acetylcholine receptor subunit alpha-7-like n=1 Tax=Solea senegalensis TaxID=28829 RepID=A0AAV6R5C6_SOLSE|nr:neuronal acetylcholine receptor subunit alpha-7-like [Solea senegalensis]